MSFKYMSVVPIKRLSFTVYIFKSPSVVINNQRVESRSTLVRCIRFLRYRVCQCVKRRWFLFSLIREESVNDAHCADVSYSLPIFSRSRGGVSESVYVGDVYNFLEVPNLRV